MLAQTAVNPKIAPEQTILNAERSEAAPANDNRLRPAVHIRSPRPDDIKGIVDVVRTCEPFLTAHMSYIYWMNVHYYQETCAVAELNGEIVGWCSMIPVSGSKYFLHQLGVAPKARRLGVAALILAHLLKQLKQQHAAFSVEFTADRRNAAVLNFNRTTAEHVGMRLVKKSEVVPILEESEEELYAMTYAVTPGPSAHSMNEHAGIGADRKDSSTPELAG
jgi:N-acetylglutamate synthase-like GNAT family acetyltransferase